LQILSKQMNLAYGLFIIPMGMDPEQAGQRALWHRYVTAVRMRAHRPNIMRARQRSGMREHKLSLRDKWIERVLLHPAMAYLQMIRGDNE